MISAVILSVVTVVAFSETTAAVLHPTTHSSLLAKFLTSPAKLARFLKHGESEPVSEDDALKNIVDPAQAVCPSETSEADKAHQCEATTVSQNTEDYQDPFADPVESDYESEDPTPDTESFVRIINLDYFTPTTKRSFFNRQWSSCLSAAKNQSPWSVETHEYKASDLTEEQRAEAKAYSDSIHKAGRAIYQSHIQSEAERRECGITQPRFIETGSGHRRSELKMGRSSLLKTSSTTAAELEAEAAEEDAESSDDGSEVNPTPSTTPQGSGIIIWNEEEEDELEPLDDLVAYFSNCGSP